MLGGRFFKSFRFSNDPVEINQHWLDADVRLLSVFRSQRPFEKNKARPRALGNTRCRDLEPVRDLALSVEHATGVLDQIGIKSASKTTC